MILFLIILYVLICMLLIVIILLQPSEGGGLSQAFGGGQVQTVFGTKTTSFLMKTTAILATIFLTICLILATLSSKREKSLLEEEISTQTEQTAPASVPESTE